MEPKYQVGDQVDHRSIPCKKEGRIEAVIERTVYILYRVRWCGCSGDYFEGELVPVPALTQLIPSSGVRSAKEQE